MKDDRLEFAAWRNLFGRNRIGTRDGRPRTSREYADQNDDDPLPKFPPDAHRVESVKSER